MPDENAKAGGDTGLFSFTVDAVDHGGRLDRVLAAAAEAAGLALSRTRVQGLIAGGHVRVGDHVVHSAKAAVREGAIIAFTQPAATSPVPAAQQIPLDVVYEDADLLVVDKPAGLVVHPSAGHADGPLVNALIAHCGASLSGVGGVKRPGIVHRLDKDTSGLLVVAKNDVAHAGLSAIFADHGRSGSLLREYEAFVWGCPDRSTGTIEGAVGRDPHNRLKMAVVAAERGRHAVTHWSRDAAYCGGVASRLRCRLETGRTHQIRVHLSAADHPLIGDDVYGAGFRTKAKRLPQAGRDAVEGVTRQALHAATLGFIHPVSGAALLFRAPRPPDLVRLDQALRACGPEPTAS